MDTEQQPTPDADTGATTGAVPVAGYDTVVVALDGSTFADRAVPAALMLGRAFGAEVHVVSVASDDAQADDLRRHATSVVAGVVTDDRVHVVTAADPAAAIGGVADELDPALVCLATHGRGRIAGALLGSVAAAVLRGSRRPMVVVGPDHREGTGLRPARLVACVDGSPASEQVLPVAASWARTLGLQLDLVTVAEPTPAPVRAEATGFRHHGPDHPEQYLDGLVQDWSRNGLVPVAVPVYDPISPAGGLRAHLDDHPAALVAVTTHARSGVERVALGSVAARIANISPAPVLVVPVTR